ncbi:hypothetical protein PG996_004203 [Apiospora saccharicola]|uniref:Uncharacterized protein n=1 Tax=Apiospora saccharicola TaxID=335842 RepID=A0ABR1W785_9PEZI
MHFFRALQAFVLLDAVAALGIPTLQRCYKKCDEDMDKCEDAALTETAVILCGASLFFFMTYVKSYVKNGMALEEECLAKCVQAPQHLTDSSDR